MVRKFVTPFMLLLIFTVTTVPVHAQAGGDVLPPHCIGSGPLTVPLPDPPDDFCGCTWGVVYYRGQPLAQAPVALRFDDLHFSSNTNYHREFPDYPYYAASALGLGAYRSDLLTLQVEAAGERLTRQFRAWPETEGENRNEQKVSLVLSEQGEWTPLFTGGYTRTLTIEDDSLWAGGLDGLVKVDVATKSITPQTLPWPESQVTAFAIGPENAYWVAGRRQLATRNGQSWQAVTAPMDETIRALAIHPQTGHVWVAGDGARNLARYDGEKWQVVTHIREPIITLVIDPTGGVWAGTWEGGVYHLPADATDLETDWVHYRLGDGLGGERVRSAAVGADSVWFGTDPGELADGYEGGLSRYDLLTDTWQTYTTTHNLPGAGDIPGAPGRIYAMAFDEIGRAWVGMRTGVQRQVTDEYWITDTATAGPVTAIATAGALVIAAQADGTLLYLDRSVTPGEAPVAQLSTPPTTTLTLSATLHLTATAIDRDEEQMESDTQILAWDWQSDIDGPLCTTADTCTLPANVLRVGEHTISLRVQDDEGVWSAPVTTTVVITEETEPPAQQLLYLPLIVAQPIAQQ